MLSKEKALEILKEADVLLDGHFLLTSGKHSDKYLQCAKIFQNYKYAQKLSKALAYKFKDKNVDIVIGPAVGAIIMSYEVSRQLNVKNIFAERENGKMTLRRGFKIEKGQRVLVVEDVVTTGGSVKEVIDLVKSHGGEIVGVGSIVDRSLGKVDFGYPFESVISIDVQSFTEEDCPLCKENKPLIKPGSRNI